MRKEYYRFIRDIDQRQDLYSEMWKYDSRAAALSAGIGSHRDIMPRRQITAPWKSGPVDGRPKAKGKPEKEGACISGRIPAVSLE